MKKDDVMPCTIEELERSGFPGCVIERIQKLQQEAFMDGYRYAISLLEESMPGGDDGEGDPR